MSNETFHTFLVNFAIAGFTSSLAKTITAPLERTKLILQNQNSALHIVTGKRQLYGGLFDCLIRLPKEQTNVSSSTPNYVYLQQGFSSLWRGNGTNLLRYVPSQALNFSFHDFFKNHVFVILQDGSQSRFNLVTYLAGGSAGACSIFVMYPLKFCQTRLSLDMGTDRGKSKRTREEVKREFGGLTDCLKKIIGKEGVSGLYRGFALAIVGSATYRSLYFGLFDSFKRLYVSSTDPQSVRKPPLLLRFAFAQSVTIIAGLLTYPLDTIGRRLVVQTGHPKELQLFRSAWDASKFMYANEGFSSFFKGGLTNAVRGMCGALVLVFYDEIVYYYKWKKKISSSENT